MIVIFCDGSYSKKERVAGVGFSFTVKGQHHDFSLPVSATDSNETEMLAVSTSLAMLADMLGNDAESNHIKLYTDSDYVDREIINKCDTSKDVRKAMESFASVTISVTKGHSGSRNPHSMSNEHVDRLAKDAMRSQLLKH